MAEENTQPAQQPSLSEILKNSKPLPPKNSAGHVPLSGSNTSAEECPQVDHQYQEATISYYDRPPLNTEGPLHETLSNLHSFIARANSYYNTAEAYAEACDSERSTAPIKREIERDVTNAVKKVQDATGLSLNLDTNQNEKIDHHEFSSGLETLSKAIENEKRSR